MGVMDLGGGVGVVRVIQVVVLVGWLGGRGGYVVGVVVVM